MGTESGLTRPADVMNTDGVPAEGSQPDELTEPVTVGLARRKFPPDWQTVISDPTLAITGAFETVSCITASSSEVQPLLVTCSEYWPCNVALSESSNANGSWPEPVPYNHL